MAKEKSANEIAKEEEQRIADDRQGKSVFYYPDHNVSIWAVDKPTADAELDKQLKADDRKDEK